MRSLVTGSSGFVGKHLTAFLRDCGDEVVFLDRADGIDVRNRESVFSFFEGESVDVVYHLAGQADVAKSWDAPVETHRVNVEGTLNVLQAAAATGASRAVVISSATVYGNVGASDLPIGESQPMMPMSPYAASKVGAEAVARFVDATSESLSVVVARPFNHIGPGQRTNFVAPGMASRIAACANRGGGVIDAGSLSPTRDFLDVGDVVSAYRALAEAGTPGSAYNICSGTETAIGDLARMLVEISGCDISFRESSDLMRPSDLPRLVGDNQLLVKETGWAPTRSLWESLEAVYAEQYERVAGGSVRNEDR